MGYGLALGGYQSGGSSIASVITGLVGKDITVNSLTATSATSAVVATGTVSSAAVAAFNVTASTGRITFTNAGRFISSNEALGLLTLTSFGLSFDGALVVASFSDGSGTPGSAINNVVRGKNAIASTAASVTITNSFVAAASTVLVSLEANDATATGIKSVVPGAGSFVLTVNAAATANLKFSFVVIN